MILIIDTQIALNRVEVKLKIRPLLSACLIGGALLSGCQTVSSQQKLPVSDASNAKTDAEQSVFLKERQAILAMVGDYKVTFDFTETVPLLKGYQLKDPKLSGGYELVRVVEDAGRFISLQHILVVGPKDAPIVVKHWRQDWQYEPESVLVFIGGNAWKTRPVADADRAGSWSQTVYQVDDAPRYGAVGKWSFTDGIAEWTPPHEWRPLPRRDMTTRNDYNAVDALNRHAITPWGWVHEQDNTKIILASGAPTALVREVGVNTYKHSTDFDPTPGLTYWDATKDYWAEVRAEWTRIAAENETFAITLKGETEDLYLPLLDYAKEVQSKEKTLEQAVQDAKAVMAKYVTSDIGELSSRLRETETVLDETAY